jgi:signal transduction histidine kinase
VLLLIIAMTALVAIYVNILNSTSIVYTHLFYIPIILAGIWYRRLALLVAVCLAVLHVTMNLGVNSFTYDPIIRGAFFVVVGYLTSSFTENSFTLLNRSKASEAKTWEVRDELECRVHECTAELKSANETLTREIEARKQIEKALRDARDQAELYVDLISHDIGNMNQAVMGYLELALELINPRGNERELIERPLKVVDSSSRLIDNVRKLQRAQSGEIPSRACDLSGALEEIIAGNSRVPGREVEIIYTPAKGCFVMANELLKDVFSNIVENSIKHSSGPVAINIRVTTRKCDTGAYHLVSIEDNGPGITDVRKKIVFMSFAQNRDRPTRRGFGLHMVKTLVEIFHGRVWIEDRIAGDHTKGTRFVVMLPSI